MEVINNMKIHINEIDVILNEFGVNRIPSNFKNPSEKEQEYYETTEIFIVERKDGTPMNTCYAAIDQARLPNDYC